MNIHGIMFKKTYSPLSQFLLSNIMFLRSHRYYVDKALGPRCVQQQKVCLELDAIGMCCFGFKVFKLN